MAPTTRAAVNGSPRKGMSQTSSRETVKELRIARKPARGPIPAPPLIIPAARG